MHGKFIKALAAFILMAAVSASAQLRVGVGKVDVTPDEGKLPEPFVSIHDHLFTRAILIENGKSSGLLMNMDVGKISAGLFAEISQDITKQYGIPMDNMVISAVHDHASVSSLGGGDALSGRPVSPNMQAFIDKVHAGMLEAVKQAKASLQPAEIGFGEGKLSLNVNRDGIDPKTRQWAEKPNLDFTSDKTLAVVEFRKPNGGEPIAIYLNYAMHAITMFLTMQISGDFPESTEQYLENAYDNKIVAIWTTAPAGDQDPLYIRPITTIGDQRIRQEMDPAKTGDAEKTEYSAAMIRLFNGPVQRPLQPIDPKLEKAAWRVVEAIGTLTGEEDIRVMDGITNFTGNAVIQGSSKVVSCPTRPRPAPAAPAGSPQPAPAANAQAGPAAAPQPPPQMQIKVGALRIGDVAIARNDSELYNQIGQEAKEGSPFRKTLIVGLANGGGGYIPSDEAFGRGTFQVAGNRLYQGCAEMGVVNAIDSLLEQDILSAPGN